MMEGLNPVGQEEYIWAMRVSVFKDSDSELWKDRKPSDQGTFLDEIKKERKIGSLVPKGDENQTKVMASLVPDEVIYNVDDYRHRHYNACLLFGDVSGFTELCEKYSKTGVAGPSKMTQVLNKYLGAMVQEVLSHSGDVLKFSGDAFLAMFKATESDTMRDVVHEAIDSAMIIQKNYGSYLTDVGVVIRVKLAISCGLLTFALIGDEKNSHYVVVGKPMWDVKSGEHISSAGDIIVAPAAWHYVGANEYLYKEMPDKIHVKLLGIGPSWRAVQRNVRHDEQEEENIATTSTESLTTQDVSQEVAAEEFSLRPAVNDAVKFNIKEPLRRFIIAPVMKSIDMEEPFEYLTEMRQVVVVFINVVAFKLETRDCVILTDRVYKIVCRVVDRVKGCVNKVSLFDKDLMLVVIFGLRGLKHELECQVALRCARECHEEINKLAGVLSTSIGVTTGKTYCGVFGHTLRREYTVISLIVNKAARLMVAYQGKVTCDRDTFLHSKLGAQHFILQKYKPLKGISHVGPVYEFREAQINRHAVHKISARPLLGRTEKLNLYTRLLKECKTAVKIQDQRYKMLIVQGEARQGKTRLLDEIAYKTPNDVPINIFRMAPNDEKIPYLAMRLIFSFPLGLSLDASSKEKEQKLLNVFGSTQVSDLLCCLNSLFGVNFKNSETYLSLDETAKISVLRNIIKLLCDACFVKLWVIAIDDCDFIDEDTWNIFDVFFEIKTVFIVGTMTSNKLHSREMFKKIIDDNRVRLLMLTPIDKVYLGAVACQILDVYAISPQLEKAIQTKSNGNPGWTESFLISLMQDGSIFIVKSTLQEINDQGLVAPPLYMMLRLTRDERLRWQHIMEEKRISQESISSHDNWRVYIDTCRDSYLNITVREQMESMSRGSKVPVCIITQDFHVGDEEAELSADAMILKTFDSLNFFEQLLVKCSAILGNQFRRDMLLYVMSADDKRKAAKAVQKLFEIKVLTCAKGDFLEGGTHVFKERLINPKKSGLICQCKGLKVEGQCLDLPLYANCGYLQFQSSLFRDITYNLLTDNQKKEFHLRAIRFLERETRKCKACGGGHFERIWGEQRDQEFLVAKGKKKQTGSSVASSFDDRQRMTRNDDASSYKSSTSVHSEGGGGRKSKYERMSVDSSASGSITSHMFDDGKGGKIYTARFGFTLINKLKNSFTLTRTFSSEDFTDCQCLQILCTTYAQLVEHCIGAGDLNKTLDAMIEYAYVSIMQHNIPLALKILTDALSVLKEKSQEKTEYEWKLSLIRAKLYILTAYSRMELGQNDAAFRLLHKALKQYGITFPKGIRKRMAIRANNTKQLIGYYLFQSYLLKQLDHWQAVFASNLAECLSHLCTIYMIRGEWDNAELAASWSLLKALEAFSDFQIMCTAFANMMFVAQQLKKWSLSTALEVTALRLCHLKKTTVDSQDLRCVATLYGVIFSTRLSRSQMEKAIHMGYIVLRLCSSIRAAKIILPLLPLLFHALLIGKHFSNASNVLQELDKFANLDSDNSGKVWYYALCITLQLEIGYAVLSYDICEQFFKLEGDSWITIRDPDARKRFVTVMWLWCVRNEKWEEATIWTLKSNDFMIISANDSIANKITALYLLEGLILFLVSKLDRRNIKAIVKAENEIKHLIKALDLAARGNKILIPRLSHLKAYFKYVKNSEARVIDDMRKAQKVSKKYGNELEYGWIAHSIKAWSRTMPAMIVDFWKEHTEADNLLDFQNIDIAGTIGYFTLPIPVYIS